MRAIRRIWDDGGYGSVDEAMKVAYLTGGTVGAAPVSPFPRW